MVGRCPPRDTRASIRRSRGSAVFVTVLVLFVAMVCVAVLAVTSRAVSGRARAQNAADAAAIAAAYDGEAEALRVAEIHGARLVWVHTRSATRGIAVDVEVEVAGVHAHATAERAECRGSCVPWA